MINTSLLRFGGAVQVALSFINECRRYGQHDYHVVIGPGVRANLEPSEFSENFNFHHRSFGVMKVHKLPRVQRVMSALEREIHPDCVVTTAGPAYWRSRAPHVIGFNRPLFIYPESPFIKRMTSQRKLSLAAQKFFHCQLYQREADALIVQTDDVNQRVRNLLGKDRVYTVTNNHNGWYDKPPRAPLWLPEREDGTFRFLTLTSYYPHKNLELIPNVISSLPQGLRSRVEFVLTISEEQYRARIGNEIPPQIRLIGAIPPPECPALYRECDAMFLPTLAECFSASYPEAMKMGKPIVTTDLGFSRSICRDAAMYFEACNPQSAANAIAHLMESGALQKSLKEQGKRRLEAFDSAAQRAEKILAICEDLAKTRSGERILKQRSPGG